jgi:homoserine kinase
MIVRAPATSANLGAGFDCAAVALDLWNELEVADGEGIEIEGEGAGELPADHTNLAVRAYALLADPAGKRFRFTNRIPLERGLGSSAAAIALGLAAGAAQEGREGHSNRLLQGPSGPSHGPADALVALGAPLEGHADNLAAALLGGVTLTDGAHAWRIADSLPYAPVLVIPERRTATGASRAALPDPVPRADAVFSVVRAALLGAGLASGERTMLARALDDRLHEPHRPSPILAGLREQLPRGAVGATLSGSGPSVLVWADDADAAAAELRELFPGERVLAPGVAGTGAL